MHGGGTQPAAAHFLYYCTVAFTQFLLRKVSTATLPHYVLSLFSLLASKEKHIFKNTEIILCIVDLLPSFPDPKGFFLTFDLGNTFGVHCAANSITN